MKRRTVITSVRVLGNKPGKEPISYGSNHFMGLKDLFKKKKQSAAIFIDFEHWCYSMSTLFGLKPDIKDFYETVSDSYDIKRIYFFGDFSESKIKSMIGEIRNITNNIIETQNPSPHIKKDYTDFIMLDYIYQDTYDYPDTDVYVILSGDGHFSSVSTYLKTKRKKKVIIYGVRNATSAQLQKIADECFLLPTDEQEKRKYYFMVIENMDYLAKSSKKKYPTFLGTVDVVSKKFNVPRERITSAIRDLLDMGVMSQELVRLDKVRRIKILKTDWQAAREKGLWDQK